MVELPCFDDPVINSLSLRKTTRFPGDPVAAFRQSHHFARRFVRPEKRLFLDQSLCAKVFEVILRASFITLVSESSKVFNVYRAESANVGHRSHLRVTKRIGLAVIFVPCPALAWSRRPGVGRSLWTFHFFPGRVTATSRPANRWACMVLARPRVFRGN